jgi:hypothetical protein
MDRNEMPEFQALLTQAMAFHRQDVSPFALSVWWEACKGFSLEQVRKAVTAHAMDPERGQFVPKPADMVRLLQGTNTDRSLVAWGKVLQAIQRVGAYTSVTFDDPAINLAIVDMGGWVKVCRSDMDELPHVERRFCAAHKAYAARSDTPFPPKLVGEHEQQNLIAGRRVAPPVLIGDQKRCQLVLAQGQAERLPMLAADAIPQISAPKAVA